MSHNQDSTSFRKRETLLSNPVRSCSRDVVSYYFCKTACQLSNEDNIDAFYLHHIPVGISRKACTVIVLLSEREWIFAIVVDRPWAGTILSTRPEPNLVCRRSLQRRIYIFRYCRLLRDEILTRRWMGQISQTITCFCYERTTFSGHVDLLQSHHFVKLSFVSFLVYARIVNIRMFGNC